MADFYTLSFFDDRRPVLSKGISVKRVILFNTPILVVDAPIKVAVDASVGDVKTVNRGGVRFNIFDYPWITDKVGITDDDYDLLVVDLRGADDWTNSIDFYPSRWSRVLVSSDDGVVNLVRLGKTDIMRIGDYGVWYYGGKIKVMDWHYED